MRGMTIGDSPIGNEYLRQSRELTEGLGAAKSASALDMGNTNANFNAAMSQFQNNLRQQSYMNRLSLSTAQPASYGMQGQLFGERQAQGTKQFKGFQTGWNAGIDLTQLLGAAMSACWIADAIYGAHSREFWLARHFIFNRWQGGLADTVRSLYMKIGRPVAWMVRHVPGVRQALKPLFDMAVARELSARG